MTGTKRNKPADLLLKLAIGLCLLFALVRAVEFVYARIPPFNEGSCITTETGIVWLSVEKNHIVDGYSELDVHFMKFKQTEKASFLELRDPYFKQIDCKDAKVKDPR